MRDRQTGGARCVPRPTRVGPGVPPRGTVRTTWLGGNIVSLAFLAGYAALKNGRTNSFWPQWTLLRKLGSTALGHHALNLTLQAPSLVMPIIVTAILSARMNAYFYTA